MHNGIRATPEVVTQSSQSARDPLRAPIIQEQEASAFTRQNCALDRTSLFNHISCIDATE